MLQRQSGAPPMAPVVNGWVTVEGRQGRFQLAGFDLFAEGPFRNELAGISSTAGFTSDWLTQPGALLLGASQARALDVAEGDVLKVLYRGNSSTLTVLYIDSASSAVADDLLLVEIATASPCCRCRANSATWT